MSTVDLVTKLKVDNSEYKSKIRDAQAEINLLKDNVKKYNNASSQAGGTTARIVSIAQGAKDSFSNMSTGIEGVTSTLEGLASKAGPAGIAIGAIGTAAISTIAKVSEANYQFQKSYEEMSTYLSSSQVNKMKQSALTFATNNQSDLSLENIAKLQTEIVKAAPELSGNQRAVDGLTKSLDDYIMVTDAAGETTEQSIKDVVDIKEEWGLLGKDIPAIIAMISNAAHDGRTSQHDFATAMAQSSAEARAAGSNMQDFASAIIVMRTHFESASQAGERYAQVLQRMEATNVEKFMPSCVGATQALENLKEYTDNGGNATKILGKRIAETAMDFANNSTKIAAYNNKLYDTGNLSKQVKVREDDLDVAEGNLKNSWQAATLELGRGVMPEWISFLKFVTSGIDDFTHLERWVNSTANSFSNLTSKNAAVKGFFNGILSTINPVISAFRSLKNLMTGVGNYHSNKSSATEKTLHYAEGDKWNTKTGKWVGKHGEFSGQVIKSPHGAYGKRIWDEETGKWRNEWFKKVKPKSEIEERPHGSNYNPNPSSYSPILKKAKKGRKRKENEIGPEGSISYMQNELTKLQTLRDDLTDPQKIARVDEEITKVNTHIDELNQKAKNVENKGLHPEKSLNLNEIQKGMSGYLSTTQSKPNASSDLLAGDVDEIKKVKEAQSDYLNQMKEQIGEINETFGSGEFAYFANMLNQFQKLQKFLKDTDLQTQVFGKTLTGLQKNSIQLAAGLTLMGNSLQEIGDKGAAAKIGSLMAAIGELMLGYAEATAQAGKLGPLGWIGFALSGAAILTSTIAQMKSYQSGGVIEGSGWSGDTNLARVNSGEMILNGNQQKNLFSMINSGNAGAGGGTVIPDVRIKGSDMYLMFKNYSKTKAKSGIVTGIK